MSYFERFCSYVSFVAGILNNLLLFLIYLCFTLVELLVGDDRFVLL